MHLCQDEIIAIGGLLGFVPYTCRWVWYRMRCLVQRRQQQKLLPPARVVHRHERRH